LSAEKLLLLLFPPARLGSRILAAFSRAGYRVIVFLLAEEDRSFCSRGTVQCLTLTAPLEAFWEGLDDSLVEATVHARAVISFVGKDYLALKVRGRGEEWSINATDPAQLRISFMEMVLGKSEASARSLWVNLSSGQHRRGPSGEVFCNTKYSLTGFSRALQLTPRLSRFEVVNLCLTYFRKGPSGSGPIHCQHCITQEALEHGENLAGVRKLPQYLLRRVEALWEQEADG
jgi:NAD(P)-dependent dehydrogenase (short-subunit alcohol dehydrogenase family)